MTHEYEYKLVDGHIIVPHDNKQLLIDTGAPSSVGDSSPLAFAGGSYSMQSSYMGISPASLSYSVGTPVGAETNPLARQMMMRGEVPKTLPGRASRPSAW